MKRRVCAALLALVLALTLLPAAAFAEEPLEGGAAVEDVPSEPGNEPGEPNEPGGDEGDNEIPGDPSEENEDENTPGSEPGEENGDENTPGSEPGEENGDGNIPGNEPGEENGDNETPTPQPNLAPTTGGSDSAAPGADITSVYTWENLVKAIEGNSANIRLEDNVTRLENDKDITISGEVTIELLGWTLNGGGKGPVITVEEGGKLTIEDASSNGNGKITGGEADNGGGIYVDGGTVTMTGGAISGNKAKSGGGVYLTNGATFTMTGGKITENTIDIQHNRGYGGGVYVDPNCSFTMDSADKNNPAEISENHGEEHGYDQYAGGGIYISGADSRLILDEAVIKNNRIASTNSAQGGGGIHAEKGASVTITNSLISGNSAFLSDENIGYETPGGGICIRNDCTLTMTGTTVSDNTARFGGGLCLWDCGDVTITSCKITNNKAKGAEGGSNPKIGGGIFYQSSGETLTITGTEENPTVISGDEAIEGGGGIANLAGTVKIDHTIVKENESAQSGGIHSQATTELTNCTLSDNEGNNAGGGIYVGGGTTTLNNCTVTRNTANAEEGWGDGAYVYGTLILNNTEIIDNQADNTGYGGGVFVNGGGQLTIDATSKIDSNTATEAAGVYNGGTVTMNGGSISGNSAAGMAGGVENANYQDSNGVIHPAVFTMNDGDISNNTAVTSAGGVANVGTFEMKDGTITGNQATQKAADNDEIAQDIGVGGGVVNYGTFTMTGGAIYGNTAATGGDDFYNYGPEPEEDGDQNAGVVVDPDWDQDHNMGLESLSAPRAGDTYGTFTLLDPSTFNIEGATKWFEDPPDDRYKGPDGEDNPGYISFENNIYEYYLTLGVEPPEEEAELIVWYYQVYLDEGDGTWLLWKHGQGGWAAPAANVKIEAADFNGQSSRLGRHAWRQLYA